MAFSVRDKGQIHPSATEKVKTAEAAGYYKLISAMPPI